VLGKAEKTAGSAQNQPLRRAASDTVSETLRQLMSRVSQAENRTRESRGTLQTGEGVLAEVQDSLSRIADLVQESAGGGSPDRDALQAELEQLREALDRMISAATAGELPLFLDGDGGLEAGTQALLAALGLDKTASVEELLSVLADASLKGNSAAGYLAALYLGAVIAGDALSGSLDPAQALEGLRQLLERMAEGESPDQAVEALTDGMFTSLADFQAQFTGGAAPGLTQFLLDLLQLDSAAPILANSSVLTLLAGFQGMDLELIMELLTAPQSQEASPERSAAEGAESAEGMAELDRAGAPVSVAQLGTVQVMGRDLSGVSYDSATGEVTIAGEADVVVQSTGQGEGKLRITGSGTVTLQAVKVSLVTVASAEARILSAGENTVAELELREGAALTMGGGGQVRLGLLRGGSSNLLRLTGGAVVVRQGDSEPLGTVTVPVVVDGPAVLAAQAASVTNAAGEPLEPVDLIWKTLLPGWSGVTAAAIDGRQAKLALTGGNSPDPARLWLAKWDAAQGHPFHTVILQGKDEFDRPKSQYAYLHWNQRTGAFERIAMYPNPFTVLGGEENQDWVYEEATHTLRILSNQVAALSGGTGTGAYQMPFSGRIALADCIGPLRLTLCGVVCRVSSGQAFSLGRENDVTLILQRGAHNHFESGAGCAGISLGEGTSLTIDCLASEDGGETAGTLTATGGAGGAGIGRDSGGGQGRTGRIRIRGGVINAAGTGGGAGIGGALGGPVGDIAIHGGSVTASATYCAAAIGAGILGESGDILITGTARIVKAEGGSPDVGIGACRFGKCGKVVISGGAEIGSAKLCARAGVPLWLGEESATLPQFPLSAQVLHLDTVCVATQAQAQAARATLDADRRWVAQLQAVYHTLSYRLEDSLSGLHSVHQYIHEAESLVRDTATASTLLREMREAILHQAAQAMGTHSKQGIEAVRRLLGGQGPLRETS